MLNLGKRPESHHGPASMQHGGTSQFDFPSLSQSSSSEVIILQFKTELSK